MTPTPIGPDTPSIFKDGKLKPGIYTIQNLQHEYYLDIHKHSKEMCCRAERELLKGRGLWEIIPLGDVGYAVKMVNLPVEPGQPAQFCNPRDGVNPGASVFVTAYPAAWRIEKVDDEIHGYARVYWGPTRMTWDQAGDASGWRLEVHDVHDRGVPWQTWIFKCVKAEGTFTPSQLSLRTPNAGATPPNDGDATGTPTQTQHAEYERDDFGTIVTEITTVTNTISTRKKYRVDDA